MKGTLADWENEQARKRLAEQLDALPETAEVEHEYEIDSGLETEPVTLMERTNAGWHVQLRLTGDGRVAVSVDEGEGGKLRAAFVPPEKALDAFNHPYCYLPR